MCGIAGLWSKTDRPADAEKVRRMASLLVHRGPDAEGYWQDGSLALGHRRLKVLDLSDAANQPFTDGRDVLVFNGEIFNFRDLRAGLSARFRFKTAGDTEVLFRALQVWGEDALPKIDGQFAFAFFRSSDRTLILARDRVGICPLYFMEDDREFCFASEIRPLLALRKSPLDRQGVADYFTYRYNIQNGRTLFKNVRRAAPAHVLKMDLRSGRRIERRYWSLRFEEHDRPAAEISRDFGRVFDAEVERQQTADVPIGLYLSGGIDSGALLSGFTRRTGQDVRAFTLRFPGDPEDGRRVEEMAALHAFQKNIFDFEGPDGAGLEEAVSAVEEPFGDLIICANHQLARRASRDIRVVLTGEGGDEAFCGYDHQRAFLKMLRLARFAPLRGAVSALLGVLPARALSFANSYPGGFGREEKERIREVFGDIQDAGAAYVRLVSLFQREELSSLFHREFLSRGPAAPDTAPVEAIFQAERDPRRAVLRAELEQLTMIVNLLKQDRFGMRYSMEGRVPFVSRSVLEFVGGLPGEELFPRVNKRILLEYAGRSPVKKKPFSLATDGPFQATLAGLWDRYVTRDAVEEGGVLLWTAVERLRFSRGGGGILAAKKAMAVLVFMVWEKCFREYLEAA
jgi:asparagine synthase (glutamine-hydrolysing)